jgi:hypothetical protein
MTFPYAHRPLLTFVSGLPPGVLVAPGQPRSLMRHAFGGIIPERIARRFSKGNNVEPFRVKAIRDFARRYQDRVDDLRCVALNLVDPDRLRGELKSVAERGITRPTNVRELLRLERWLQALHAKETAGRAVVSSATAHARTASGRLAPFGGVA